MRTGEVQLESVNTGALNQTSQFLPTLFVVLLHDRRNEHVVRIFFLHLPKFFEPNFDWSIRNQLDILETNHFTVVARAQLAVTRDDVDYLAGFQADGLRYCATPSGVKGFRDHARVGSRRAGTKQKRIGEFDSVYGD